MEKILKISYWLYAIGLAGLGIQQLMYADFRPVILPPSWPPWLHVWGIGAYLTGAVLLIASAMLLMGRQRKMVAVLVALFLLVAFLFFQAPYLLFVSQYAPWHLGTWTNPLKEVALSGGAMVLAAACWRERKKGLDPEAPLRNGLMSLGRGFFSVMLIALGIDQFFDTPTETALMPQWLPGPYLWAYLAGIILICSGICMLLKIKISQVSLLIGLLLLASLLISYIPRAIMMPTVKQGNEVTRIFEMLAFIGTSFMLYVKYNTRLSIEALGIEPGKAGVHCNTSRAF